MMDAMVCLSGCRISSNLTASMKKDNLQAVKSCVLGAGASLKTIGLKWLSGLFGLFFAIDQTNASNYLWDQLKTLEPTPMFLGLQAEFEDHGQCCDSEPLVR